MLSIEKNEQGKYVVRNEKKIYGRYPSEVLALYRVNQILISRGNKDVNPDKKRR